MTLYSTPIYGITWADLDTPLTQLADVTEQAAKTTEAALARGGIAPPAAQDLAAVAGRVAALESRLPAAWSLVSSPADATYSQDPGLEWATFAGMGASITAPAGRYVEVEFCAPTHRCEASSGLDLRLVINGAIVDASTSVVGTIAIQFPRVTLAGGYLSTGGPVTVSAQGRRVGSAATLRGVENLGPYLRARYY